MKTTKGSEAGVMPSHELLAGEGLQPSAKGVRVRFPEATVADGPLAETKELIAGY